MIQLIRGGSMKRDLLIFQGAMILFVAAMLTLAGNYIYKKEIQEWGILQNYKDNLLILLR